MTGLPMFGRRKLLSAVPAAATVPAGLYPHQYDAIETVGTSSFILARPGLDDPIGRRLAATLYKAQKSGVLPKPLAQTTANNTLAAIPGPAVLQPGVATYYREIGLLK